GTSVLVLGASYRGGVKETAFSGVFPLVESLQAKGARPFVTDPMYTPAELEAEGLPAYRGETVTAAVVQADHGEYRGLTPSEDRKSTRLNSSHVKISYAVFCL